MHVPAQFYGTCAPDGMIVIRLKYVHGHMDLQNFVSFVSFVSCVHAHGQVPMTQDSITICYVLQLVQ